MLGIGENKGTLFRILHCALELQESCELIQQVTRCQNNDLVSTLDKQFFVQFQSRNQKSLYEDRKHKSLRRAMSLILPDFVNRPEQRSC